MSAQYELNFNMRGSGFKVNEMAGESLGEHKLVYRGADGFWWLADADAAATMPVLGITMGAIGGGGRKGEILKWGYIGDVNWTWVAPGEIYVSTTAGELTQTAPTGIGDIRQVVAKAVTDVIIEFQGSVSGNKSEVIVRKDAGADVGVRPRLNFHQGPNMIITITDDSVDNEIDIDLASIGGGGTSWLNQYFPAVDTIAHKGTHPTIPMIDLVDTDIWQGFMIPTAIVTVVRAVILIIPDASGDIYWECSTNFGMVCANEDYQQHTDSIAPTATAIDLDQIECLDVSAALTGAAGDDIVGIKFTRLATHVNDTINDTVHYLGVLIQGSV